MSLLGLGTAVLSIGQGLGQYWFWEKTARSGSLDFAPLDFSRGLFGEGLLSVSFSEGWHLNFEITLLPVQLHN